MSPTIPPNVLRSIAEASVASADSPTSYDIPPGTTDPLPGVSGFVLRDPSVLDKVPRRVGRPGKLTDELEHDICEAIRLGAWDHAAAGAAGISSHTFKMWMADPRPRYRQFAESINTARMQARISAEMDVRKSDPKFWLARGPHRRDLPDAPGWSDPDKKTTVEITGANGGPIQVLPATLNLGALSNAEFEEFERIATKALTGGIEGDIIEGESAEIPSELGEAD